MLLGLDGTVPLELAVLELVELAVVAEGVVLVVLLGLDVAVPLELAVPELVDRAVDAEDVVGLDVVALAVGRLWAR